MNIPKIPFVFFLAIFIFNTASALWWGENSVIFENKKTGEIKSTYQMLYRFDNEEFRDALAEYSIKDGVPNDKLFQYWTVAYFKHCDRNICKTQWDSAKYSHLNTWQLPKMEPKDLTVEEIEIFLPIPFKIKVLILLAILALLWFIYSYASKFPANRIARWIRLTLKFAWLAIVTIFLGLIGIFMLFVFF